MPRPRTLTVRSSSLSIIKPISKSFINRYKSIDVSSAGSLLLSSLISSDETSPAEKPRNLADPSRRSPRVPIELIEQVVKYMLTDKPTKTPRLSPKTCTDSSAPRINSFKPIAAFSRASTVFRKISLRLYFSALTLRNPRVSARLWKILHAQGPGEGFFWIK